MPVGHGVSRATRAATVRASERQRASGQQRPAWAGERRLDTSSTSIRVAGRGQVGE